jgi:hypothetical protein
MSRARAALMAHSPHDFALELAVAPLLIGGRPTRSTLF